MSQMISIKKKLRSSRTKSRRKGNRNGMIGEGDGLGLSSLTGRQSKSHVMSYGKPIVLKLPELNGAWKKEGEKKGATITGKKSTKHEPFDIEKIANSIEAKLSVQRTFEIDKKLKSIDNSVTEFEKTNKTFIGRVQSALRKSEADALTNRMAAFRSGADESAAPGDPRFPHYNRFMQNLGEPEEDLTDLFSSQTISQKDTLMAKSLPSSPSYSRLFGLDHGHGGENGESTSGSDSSGYKGKTVTKLSSQISSGENKKRMAKPNYMDWDDEINKSTEKLRPLMPKLSDKAFLSNLKKHGGKTKENIQEMRNQIDSIKQKVEIDRRKAAMAPEKLLYDPRRALNRTLGVDNLTSNKNKSGSRAELIDFLQSHGGNTGSWKAADHQTFLQAYRRFKDHPDMLIASLLQQIPGKNAKDVMGHVKWYEQYNSLVRGNQEQLQKWDAEKRQDRQMIYQMATEGQRSKLDDEKRRQERLKNNREEEKLRGRNSLSRWKLQKLKESGVLSDTAKVLPNVDFEDIQKEMLDLAEKIQAVTKPKSEILKPPLVRAHLRGRGTKDNQKDIKYAKSTLDLDQDSFINAKLNSKDTMENKITTTNEDGKVTVNLPRIGNVIKISPTLDSGASEIEEFESESIDHPVTCDVMFDERTLSQDASVSNEIGGQSETSSKASKMALPFPFSKLTQETLSHKIRAHSQKLKKLELSSQSNKDSDRYEEGGLWGAPTSVLSFGSRRATPSWRKM